MDIAASIKYFRHASNLTQDDLAVRIGVTRSTVAQWETGRTEPRIGNLMRISLALGVTTTALIEGGSSGNRPVGSNKYIHVAYERAAPRRQGDTPSPSSSWFAVPAGAMTDHPHARATLLDGCSITPMSPQSVAVLYDPGRLPATGKLALVQDGKRTMVMRHVSPGSGPAGAQPMLVHPRQVLGTVLWLQAAQAIAAPS